MPMEIHSCFHPKVFTQLLMLYPLDFIQSAYGYITGYILITR